jgi:hypothetical protein
MFDAKLEMAVMVALTYLYAKTRHVGQTRKQWMEQIGYLLAADLYMR